MSERRPQRLSGWQPPTVEDRRKRDWIGWHTAFAAALGIALPLIIGVVVGAFSVGPGVPDLTRDPAALEERYNEEWQREYERRGEIAYAERLRELIGEEPDGPDTPWARGFRAGWIDGQLDVVAQMRAASVAEGLGETRIEWRVLDQLERDVRFNVR